MSKLPVNQAIRDKLAQEIKAAQNEKRAKTKYESDKVATKKRGDELRDNINMERLLNHDDKLYFEEVFNSL